MDWQRLADARRLFEAWHPYSDLIVAIAAIAIWEALRVLIGIFRTPKGRRKQLAGNWTGTGGDIYVANGARVLTFTLSMTLKVRSTSVEGSAQLSAASGDREKLTLSGGFYNDRFLRLNYHNEKKDQLGVIFLEFGANSDVLKGSYSGFSPRRSTIVCGTVELVRPARR